MDRHAEIKQLIDKLSDTVLQSLGSVVSEEIDGPVPSDFLFAVLLAAAAKARGWDKTPVKGV